MPQIIQAIDEIARAKQRDVIFVQFHNFNTGFVADYRTNPSRQAIMIWLDEQCIAYAPCGGFDSGCIIEGYDGELYINVPIDDHDDNFLKLCKWFLPEEGKPSYESAWLSYLPLAVALLNCDDAEHDHITSIL